VPGSFLPLMIIAHSQSAHGQALFSFPASIKMSKVCFPQFEVSRDACRTCSESFFIKARMRSLAWSRCSSLPYLACPPPVSIFFPRPSVSPSFFKAKEPRNCCGAESAFSEAPSSSSSKIYFLVPPRVFPALLARARCLAELALFLLVVGISEAASCLLSLLLQLGFF